jgi:hypothetical protein
MFLDRVAVVIEMTWREKRGLTRVRLTETRRKVTAYDVFLIVAALSSVTRRISPPHSLAHVHLIWT